MILGEGEDAKSVVSCSPQRHTELGLVHAETARSSACCGEVDISPDDLCAAEAAGFKPAKITDQIARRKVNRVAQAAGAEFLAKLVRRAVCFWKGLATITGASQKSLDQPLVLPGKPAKKDGYFAAFPFKEGNLMGAQ